MKVLLTGANGFIGKYIVALLQSKNIGFVVLGRQQPESVTDAQFIFCDLLNEKNLREKVEAAKCSHLLHLAWYVEHGKFWFSKENLNWVGASCRLISYFTEAGGQHVIAAGSCAEYSTSDDVLIEDISETEPTTLYGCSKDALRRMLQVWCSQQGVRFAWGRIFLPFGIGEDQRKIMPSVMKFFENPVNQFVTELDSIRDFIYVKDLASVFIFLLQTNAQGVFNLCSGSPTSIRELIIKLAEPFGYDGCNALKLFANAGSATTLIGSVEKLHQLGWKANFTLEDALKDMQVKRNCK